MTWFRTVWGKALLGVTAGLLLLAGVGYLWRGGAPAPPAWRTAAVKRGDLVATVSATGTIEPEEVVDVGTQVVGMIKEFGRDPGHSDRPIDYLSAVEAGTVLARIDDAIYRARADRAVAQVEQAQAQLEQAQANLRRAQADVLQLRARFNQADSDWQRARKLRPVNAITEVEYDALRAAQEVARANVQVGDAAIDQARAARALAEKALAVARADYREAEQNLAYPGIGPVLPAMGYGRQMIQELQQTINAADADVVIVGTPIDLGRFLTINKPLQRARYELHEVGRPTLEDVLRTRFARRP